VGGGLGGLGGGGRGSTTTFGAGNVNAVAGGTNTGGGGGGGDRARLSGVWISEHVGQPGGSGVVIIRYPSGAKELASIGAGLTYSFTDDGVYKRYVFTAGTDTISF
jgi:hypothetical protein